MGISDWLMILAVLAAPLVAVQVQKWLERYRDGRERKVRIFKVLMATRATGLSTDHVQALNLIDLEFVGGKFRKTRERWKEYLDHLGNFPRDDEKLLPLWSDKKADLLVELLIEMGNALGYQFDAVNIKKGAYLPEGYTRIEQEQSLLRQRGLQVLFGDAALKMYVEHFPYDEEAARTQRELNELLLRVFKNSNGISVIVKNGEDDA